MAAHSSILAWRIPWTEEPGRLRSMVWQELDMTEQLNHCHRLSKLSLKRVERVALCHLTSQQRSKNSNPVLLNPKFYLLPIWVTLVKLLPTLKCNHWDFLGGPVVKTKPSNAGVAGSIPGQGTNVVVNILYESLLHLLYITPSRVSPGVYDWKIH